MKKKIIIWCAAGIVIAAAIVIGIILIANSAASGTIDERADAAAGFVQDGKLTKAANTYKSIIAEDPGNKDAALGLSEVYKTQEKYEDAAKALREAIAFSPDDTELIDELLAVYRDSGDSVSALRFVESMTDAELRHEYIDSMYDRTSESRINVGNTMGNLANGGVAAFDDDAIYYCDIAKGNMLFKIKDGEKTLLVDGEISSLNIVGDYLYFVDKSRDYSIFKIKKDGTDHSRVKKVMATELIAIGNKLFFINWNDECRVYTMNIDGSDMKRISEHSTDTLYAYGSYLYISDKLNQNELYKLSMDGTSEVMVTTDQTYFVNGYDDLIFYRNGTDALNVYRMSTDGTVYEPMNSVRSAFINADGGYVFYVDYGDNGAIHRMTADGSENVRICEDSAMYLSVDGDYIYYFNEYDDKRLYRIKKDGSGRELVG